MKIFGFGGIQHEVCALLNLETTSWITPVPASSWRTSENRKMSHHHRGDHDFFSFTMHTNILWSFFVPNCRFLLEGIPGVGISRQKHRLSSDSLYIGRVYLSFLS